MYEHSEFLDTNTSLGCLMNMKIGPYLVRGRKTNHVGEEGLRYGGKKSINDV